MKVGVVIPTYNERDNVVPLVEAVLAADERVWPVIVDDDSPDGTGELADELAGTHERVSVIHRYESRGRGYAGVGGFRYCLKKGCDYVMEMDCDFSHNPRHIPEFLQLAPEFDVVIGSRHIAGGGERGRNPIRPVITFLARLYLRTLLGLWRVRDVTSGFRCFSREALEEIGLDSLRARGPEILTEMLFRARRMRITEMAISFEERRAGESKFNFAAMRSSLIMALRLRMRLI